MFKFITYKQFLISCYVGVQLIWDIGAILFVILAHASFWVIPIEILIAAVGGFIGIWILTKIFPLLYDTTKLFKPVAPNTTKIMKERDSKN